MLVAPSKWFSVLRERQADRRIFEYVVGTPVRSPGGRFCSNLEICTFHHMLLNNVSLY